MDEVPYASGEPAPGRDPQVSVSGAGASTPRDERDAVIEAEVAHALVQRLLAASPVAELAHVVLAALVAALLVPRVNFPQAIAWAVAIAAVAGGRAYWRGRTLRAGAAARRMHRGLRAWVAATGVLWGLGAAWLATHAPFGAIALVLVVLAGIVAGGMTTLTPDPTAFRILLACTVGLPAIGLVAGGLDHDRLAALLLITVFAGFEQAVHRRSYLALLEHERTKALAVRQREDLRESLERVVRAEAERGTLEEQLRQAQKMEAIGQLAGGVAHDFNNLLTTVLVANEMLATDERPDARRQDTDLIRQAALRGADLTAKLLAFSRQQPLERRLVALDALLMDFYGMARRILPEDVEISLHVDAPDAVISADPIAVHQILMNLVTNARDAMPAGGTLTLKIAPASFHEGDARPRGWRAPGNCAVLEVGDTGVGMTPETKRRMFDPFFTTKPLDRHTGLGMAVVYGLVKQHDGFVDVESKEGCGTVVRVHFPVEAGTPEATSGPDAGEVTGGREVVLLVEDDASLRRATKRVLEKFGYVVHTASDGDEALEYLRSAQSEPDLVISDVVMPRASGPELLHRMREGGWQAKVLFTSGYTARDMQERATLDADLPFLAKPWTVTALLRTVRDVIDAEQVR